MPTVDIKKYPIRYPKSPPITEPAAHMNAKEKERLGIDTHKAINKTSGGIGKNEDSQRASIKSAHMP